jgi:CMP-N-acetylneuraminic acid synthetase
MVNSSADWLEKRNSSLTQIREQTRILYLFQQSLCYTVLNAMQFKEINGISLSADESKVLENSKTHRRWKLMRRSNSRNQKEYAVSSRECGVSVEVEVYNISFNALSILRTWSLSRHTRAIAFSPEKP